MRYALAIGTALVIAALAQPGGGGGPGGIVTDFTGLGTVTVDAFVCTAAAAVDSIAVVHVTGVTTWTGTSAVVSGIENLGAADLTLTDSLIGVTADLSGALTGTTGTFTGDLQSEDFTATDSTTGVTADYSGLVDAGSVHVGTSVTSDSAATWTPLTNLITVGAGSVGDVDFDINWDSGGATVLALSINYGTARWQTNSLGLFVDGLLTTNTTLRIGSIMESSVTDMYIDPENSGVGVVHLGLDADADTARVDTNCYFDVDGTANFDGATQVDALSFDAFFATSATYDSTATVGASIYVAILNQATGQDTLNLAAASGQTGRTIVVKCIHANGSVVDANASETIDGSTTQALAQWDSITIYCTGATWYIL